MAYTLVDNSTVAYNGVYLNQYPIRTEVSPRVVYDDANRLVKWVEYTIKVRGMLYLAPKEDGSPQTTDDTIESLRTKLQTPGKDLRFLQKGLGEISINFPGTTMKDVNFGPKATFKRFVVFGNGQAVDFEWECVTAIPECSGSAFEKALSMACYKVTHEFDDQGLVTVTTAGAIEVALTFGPTATLPDNIDNYWDITYFPVQAGFRRLSRRKEISMDRRRIDYVIVDQQIPVAYADNMTLVDLHHKVSSQSASGRINFTKWRHTISGTLRSKPGISKDQTWVEFIFFVLTRVGKAIDPATNGGKRAQWVPQHIEIDESVMGLETAFTYVYDVVISDLRFLLANSGLWMPAALTDASGNVTGPQWSFDTWKTSLDNDVNSARGVMQLRYRNQDDTLIDLCTKNPDPEPGSGTSAGPVNTPPAGPEIGAGPPINPNGGNPYVVNPGVSFFVALFPPATLPDPIVSYFVCDFQLGYREVAPLVRHKPLSPKAKLNVNRPAFDPINLLDMQQATGLDTTGVTTGVPDILQRLVSPSAEVTVSGQMMRLGYRPIPPRLVTYNGEDMTTQQIDQDIKEMVVGYVGGLPVFGMWFSITYALLQNVNNSRPLLANPVNQTPGYGLGSASAFQPGAGA
jgi:hypothetical protein